MITKTEEIKFDIQCLERRLVSDHFDHELRKFVPATGETRDWILASIKSLKARLPQARYDDQVARYGWRSVERNA